jgi:hypothetical protein
VAYCNDLRGEVRKLNDKPQSFDPVFGPGIERGTSQHVKQC